MWWLVACYLGKVQLEISDWLVVRVLALICKFWGLDSRHEKFLLELRRRVFKAWSLLCSKRTHFNQRWAQIICKLGLVPVNFDQRLLLNKTNCRVVMWFHAQDGLWMASFVSPWLTASVAPNNVWANDVKSSAAKSRANSLAGLLHKWECSWA